MCKVLYWIIPIFMLESVGKFHCGHWNVLEISTVPAEIHMLENSISPVVWSCDIHHICWNFASVLVTVWWNTRVQFYVLQNDNPLHKGEMELKSTVLFTEVQSPLRRREGEETKKEYSSLFSKVHAPL